MAAQAGRAVAGLSQGVLAAVRHDLWIPHMILGYRVDRAWRRHRRSSRANTLIKKGLSPLLVLSVRRGRRCPRVVGAYLIRFNFDIRRSSCRASIRAGRRGAQGGCCGPSGCTAACGSSRACRISSASPGGGGGRGAHAAGGGGGGALCPEVPRLVYAAAAAAGRGTWAARASTAPGRSSGFTAGCAPRPAGGGAGGGDAAVSLVRELSAPPSGGWSGLLDDTPGHRGARSAAAGAGRIADLERLAEEAEGRPRHHRDAQRATRCAGGGQPPACGPASRR